MRKLMGGDSASAVLVFNENGVFRMLQMDRLFVFFGADQLVNLR